MTVRGPVKLSFRPTNPVSVLSKWVSPLVESMPVEVLARTTLAEPPAEVTTPDTCPAFDQDGSGAVTIDELITAVNNLRQDCRP